VDSSGEVVTAVGKLESLHLAVIACSSKDTIQMKDVFPHMFHLNHSNCMIWSLAQSVLQVIFVIEFKMSSTVTNLSKQRIYTNL
jgi:hypothetical protein